MSGIVFWITGLSGAGKTTVGKELYRKIKEKTDAVLMLDGDELRKTIAADLGYTQEDRHESARRNTRLCKLLADQGMHVVCCTICMFEDIRKWSRDNNDKYIEVYLKVPMDVLRKRNQKNLYEDAEDELVGLGVGMEEPEHPDIVVINDGKRTAEDIADEIMLKAEKLGI